MTGISGPPQFPDRRIARTPDRIERQAGARLAAMAFALKLAVSAVRHCPIFGYEAPPILS
jgi:hypothetical protein